MPESQLSLAIGRRGQNVRLASQLTGWDIDILTEQEESERRQKEFAERTQLFMEALDVDEVIAQLLATEGFETVQEVAYVDAGEIAHIEGFDEDTASEIQTRARDYLERQEAERDAKRKELGVSDDLAKVPGVTTAMLVAFGENGIKTLEDLAGAETDDLSGWTERKKEKDAEPVRHKGVLEGFEMTPQGRRGHDHGGAHCRRLGHAGGPRQDARRAGGRGCRRRGGEGRGTGRQCPPRPRRKRSWRGAEA